MTNISGIVSGVAGRYATALFELADEAGSIDSVDADVAKLAEAFETNPELKEVLSDLSVSRAEMRGVVDSLSQKLGLSTLTRNFLGLMASKRRLGALPKALSAYEALAAEHRGETTAQVVSAAELTADQKDRLSQTLAAAAGRAVKIQTAVDPELIGGLVVTLGSAMVDASVRSKLLKLQHAMKEAG